VWEESPWTSSIVIAIKFWAIVYWILCRQRHSQHNTCNPRRLKIASFCPYARRNAQHCAYRYAGSWTPTTGTGTVPPHDKESRPRKPFGRVRGWLQRLKIYVWRILHKYLSRTVFSGTVLSQNKKHIEQSTTDSGVSKSHSLHIFTPHYFHSFKESVY